MTTPTTARAWLEHLLDPGWSLLFDDIVGTDALRFPGYDRQLADARDRTGASESVLVGEGTILGDAEGIPAILIAFEFGFLGGSMGTAGGERICRAFEHAAERGLPVLALTASGGARMQEGMAALAQMPATIAARDRLAEAGAPFVAYLRNPTTGGVFASFAQQADLLWAEPGATIGFAGPRVVETMSGEPVGASHTAESALEAGLIDQILSPGELKGMAIALRWVRPDRAQRSTSPPEEPARPDRSPWEQVLRARDAERRRIDPVGGMLALRSPHPSVRCGFAQIGGRNVVAIVQRASAGNAPLPTAPSAYRSARHAIGAAERLHLPVVTFIDTPGADPRSAAERDGIAREIALTFDALLRVRVPTVACVTGEGGSGGALALAACDRLLIQRDAVFSVIPPEGAASILKRDDVETVAADLKLTAHDLRELGLADLVVDEPDGGVPADPDDARATLHAAIGWALADIGDAPPTERRRARWRMHGDTR